MSDEAEEVPLILRLVHESTNIVKVAGSIVRKVLKSGDLDIVDKGTNDLQTKADRAAQVYLTQKLREKFPLSTIIGEEGDEVTEDLEGLISPPLTPNDSSTSCFPEILGMKDNLPQDLKNIKDQNEIVIWIDPLDGTSEFTKGLLSHVTILIGMAHQVTGDAIGGVIHQPFYKDPEGGEIIGRTLWGIPSVGYGGFTLKKVATSSSTGKIVTTTRSHPTPQVEAALKALNPSEVIRAGGAGNKVIFLLEGKAHAYVFASGGCKKWDTCGPEAVLRACGGKLTDMDGRSYKYFKDVKHANEEGLLATAPGEQHQEYIRNIRKF